ncbi:MAG: hypothetical protein V9E94_20870 [Microthrixaceae bacterium]
MALTFAVASCTEAGRGQHRRSENRRASRLARREGGVRRRSDGSQHGAAGVRTAGARPRRGPEAGPRGRQQLLQRQLGDRTRFDHGTRRVGTPLQRPVVFVVSLQGRPRRADRTVESPEERGLLLRLSVPGDADSGGGGHGAPVPNPAYGGQLQDRAINGVPVEGSVRITTREIRGDLRGRYALHPRGPRILGRRVGLRAARPRRR